MAYQVYLEEAGTNLADISASSGGSSIAGSTVTVADIAGLGPAALRWWGPTDETDELYLRCPSDPTLPVQRVEAVTDPRLDALELVNPDGRLDLLEGVIVNAKAPPYNAAGDGSVDDQPELQAAIDAFTGAVDPAGGTVYLPKGTYLLGAQLKVKHGVRLLGAGKRATILKAAPGFPVSTALVRLGHGAGVAFDARLDHLTVDTNGITGSIGVYSNEAQEGAGVFNCLVRNTRDLGIHFATGTENTGIVDTEVLPVTGTGIRFEGVAGQGYVEHVTIGEISGSGTLTTCLDVLGGQCSAASVHVERCTNGVYFRSGAHGLVESLYGHPTVTNLFRNDSSTNRFTLTDLTQSGATNVVVDEYNSVTLTNAGLDVSGVLSYIPRKAYYGTASLRPATGAVQIDGQLHFADSATNLKQGASGFLRTDGSFDAVGRLISGFATGTQIHLTTGGVIELGSAGDTNLKRSAANVLATDDDFALLTAGKGLQVKEGSNAKMGVATLVAGSVVVSNTSVTANSRIFITGQAPGGTPGFVRVSARTAGTSFTITSSSGSDTSTVAFLILEPA